MVMLDDSFPPQFRSPSRFEQAEATLAALIDGQFGLLALLIAKGLISWEEVERMEPIARDARRGLGLVRFSPTEMIKATVASFRITGLQEKK